MAFDVDSSFEMLSSAAGSFAARLLPLAEHARAPKRFPRRLSYVVNRGTAVDQSTRETTFEWR